MSPISNPPQSSKKSASSSIATAGRRTTVLHLTTDLAPSAYARSVIDLALLTHRAGWKPLIASSGGALVLEAERSAIRHTRMPLNRHNLFASWRNRVHLEALIHRMRPDIIHAHGIEVLAKACAISAAHHIPLLVDLVEPIPVTKHNKRQLQIAVARGAFFRVPTDFMVNHLQADLKLRSPLLYRVSPGIDLKWYEASRISAERVQALVREWRVPEAATIAVTATPQAPGQGHKQILEALAKIKRPDLFTVMVGQSAGNFSKELEALIHSLGLSGQVVLAEFCQDWPAACWLASVMIAANTLPRGQAQDILAAQAVGRPVIATDCGANGELVRSGETAWLIPKDDQNALTEALREATQLTMAQRVDLAERTRAFVAENYAQENWFNAMLELYKMMLVSPTAMKVGR